MDPTSDQKVALSVLGIPISVHPQTAAEIPASPSTVTAQVMAPEGKVSIITSADRVCVSGPPGTVVRTQIPEAPRSADYFFQLTYDSSMPQLTRAITYDDGSATYNLNQTVLPAGVDVSVADRVDGTEMDELWLSFEAGVNELCLRSVWIGRVAGDDGTGCQILSHLARPTGEVSDCSTTWPA
jgi:hypothetical protein